MSTMNFEPVSAGDARAEATLVDGGEAQLRLSGTADQRGTEFLDGVLERFHAEALRLGVDRVSVDFRELEFMNSTAFKSFLTWITNLVGLDEDEQYAVRFVSTTRYPWQQRSLEALRCFAVNLITVEV